MCAFGFASSFAWYVPRENRYNLVLEDLFGITQETLLEGSVVADFHESRMLNGTSQSLRLVRARAKRVVFENDGSGRPMAVGVADEDGCFYEARSKVILSGGVFGTFEVLLASGIGPDAMLQQLGVDPVAVNEDVGKDIGDESELTIGYYAPNAAEVRPDYIQTILGTFNGSHIAHGTNPPRPNPGTFWNLLLSPPLLIIVIIIIIVDFFSHPLSRREHGMDFS